MTSNPSRPCAVCGFDGWHESRPWLLLAAWAVGTDAGLEAHYTPEDLMEHRSDWECDPETGAVDASGSCVCWPDCAHQFIEAAMVSCEFTNSRLPE